MILWGMFDLCRLILAMVIDLFRPSAAVECGFMSWSFIFSSTILRKLFGLVVRMSGKSTNCSIGVLTLRASSEPCGPTRSIGSRISGSTANPWKGSLELVIARSISPLAVRSLRSPLVSFAIRIATFG
jgi:hypothetical protein